MGVCIKNCDDTPHSEVVWIINASNDLTALMSQTSHVRAYATVPFLHNHISWVVLDVILSFSLRGTLQQFFGSQYVGVLLTPIFHSQKRKVKIKKQNLQQVAWTKDRIDAWGKAFISFKDRCGNVTFSVRGERIVQERAGRTSLCTPSHSRYNTLQ